MVRVRPIFWLALGGATVLFLVLRRKDVGAAVVSAGEAASGLLSAAERAIIKGFVPDDREAYIDGAFDTGAKYGIDPYLLLGILYTESGFGRGLTAGQAFGRTVYTGDFIPRIATPERDAFMAKYPLPGAKKVYWERPAIGNLPAHKGLMWVPAHDLRVSKFGVPGAYSKNGGIAGGVGWGFTPWQLDWQAYAADLIAGAAWDETKATQVALTKQIMPAIAAFKKLGLTNRFDLINGVIASYNVGIGGATGIVKRAIAEGRSVAEALKSATAGKDYVESVSKIARAAGREILV